MNKREADRLNRAQIKEAKEMEKSVKQYKNHKKAIAMGKDGTTSHSRRHKRTYPRELLDEVERQQLPRKHKKKSVPTKR